MGKKRRMRARLNKFGSKYSGHPRLKNLQNTQEEKIEVEALPKPAPEPESKTKAKVVADPPKKEREDSPKKSSS